MSKKKKQFLSLLLSALLLLTAFPVAAFAEDPTLEVYLFIADDHSTPEDEIPIGSTFSTSIDLYANGNSGLEPDQWTGILLVQTDGTNQYKLYENGVVYLGGRIEDPEHQGPGWIQDFSSNTFQPGTYKFRIVTAERTVDSTNIFRVTGTPMAQPPQVNTGTLKNACLGASYSAQVKATAGNGGALTWKVLSGKLPDGLKLEAKTGKITGKPTKKGTFDFVLSVTEAGNGSADASYTIAVGDHSWNKGEVTKQASCEENGEKTFTCKNCGETKTEPIDATGHAWGDWKKVDGKTHRRVCANDPSHIETAAHKWNKGKVTKEAACEEDGEKTYTCAVCKAVKTETVPAAGHAFGEWTKLNDDEHQRVCANDPSHVETAAHTWNKGKVTKQPTCEENGEKTFTCTACGAKKTETVPATGHKFGDWTKLNEDEHRRVCANDPSHVETAAHLWDDGKVTKEATCAAEGENTRTCAVCGATRTEPVAKTAHTEKTVPGKAPTCDEPGYGEGLVCAVCGEILQPREPIPATGHAFGEWTKLNGDEHQRVCANDPAHTETAAHSWNKGKITKKATCTAEGEKTYTCTDCGATRTEPMAKTAHTEKTVPGKEPTCTEAGLTEGAVCAVCGETIKAQETIPAPGHVDADGNLECDRCGIPMPRAIEFDPPLPYTSNGLTVRVFIPAGDGNVFIEVANESGKPVKDDTKIRLSCFDEDGNKITDAEIPISADLSDGEYTIIYTGIKAGEELIDQPARIFFDEIVPEQGYDYDESNTEEKNGVTVQKDYVYDGVSASVEIKEGKDGEKTAEITVSNEGDRIITGDCTLEYKLCGEDGRVVATVETQAFSFADGPVTIPAELLEGATKILIGEISVPEQRPPQIEFDPPLPYTSNGLTIRQFIPAGDGSVYIEVANGSGGPVKDTSEITLACYDENGEKIADASVPLGADLSDGEFTIIRTEIKAGDRTVDTPAKVAFGETAPAEGYDYDESLTGTINGVTVQKGLLYEGLAFTVTVEDGGKRAVITVTDEAGAQPEGEFGFEYKLCGDDGRVIATLDSPAFAFDGEEYVEIPVELLEDANKILIGKVTVPEKQTGKSFTLGDVNGDGKINSSDARLALRAAARLETLTPLQEKLADVSGDGKVKSGDARTILRIAARLEPKPETQISE